jgi:hypothetical protein
MPTPMKLFTGKGRLAIVIGTTRERYWEFAPA